MLSDAQGGREGGEGGVGGREGGTHASMQEGMDDCSEYSVDRQHGPRFGGRVAPLFGGRVAGSNASVFSSVQHGNEEGQHGPFGDGPVFRGEVYAPSYIYIYIYIYMGT